MSVWTREAIATLKQMHADGETFAAIAAAIGGGMSRNAAIGKATRLGLTGNRRVARPSTPKPPLPKTRVGLPRTVKVGVKKKSQPMPPEPPRPPVCEPVRLLDLAYGHCRFPIGEACGADTLFCGAAKAPAGSYCTYHRAVATGQGTLSERAAAGWVAA